MPVVVRPFTLLLLRAETSLREPAGPGCSAGPAYDRSIRLEALAALAAVEPRALFATELFARLQARGAGASAVADALQALERAGAVQVTRPAPPDPHLAAFDLRMVALVPPELPPAEGAVAAVRAADVLWGRWLREFLASHRCQ